MSKELVSILNPGFHGHTEYLASAFGIAKFDMMFVAPHLKVVIVTRHVPLAKVSALITAKAVFDSIMLAHKVLRTQFKIRKPRIAVCGVNPHAGENGLMGDEEVRHVIPAVRKARKAGVTIEGPMAADTLFIGARSAGFDCVVAMYHDQGLTPIKTLYFKDVVNLTTGLPFVRTSPAHGTAFDIAGKRKADPSSMVAAIRLAAQLTR